MNRRVFMAGIVSIVAAPALPKSPFLTLAQRFGIPADKVFHCTVGGPTIVTDDRFNDQQLEVWSTSWESLRGEIARWLELRRPDALLVQVPDGPYLEPFTGLHLDPGGSLQLDARLILDAC